MEWPPIIFVETSGGAPQSESSEGLLWQNSVHSSSSTFTSVDIEWSKAITPRFSAGAGASLEYARSHTVYDLTLCMLFISDEAIPLLSQSLECESSEYSPELFAHVEYRIYKGLKLSAAVGLGRAYMFSEDYDFILEPIFGNLGMEDSSMDTRSNNSVSAIRTRLDLGLEYALNERWSLNAGYEQILLGDYTLTTRVFDVEEPGAYEQFGLPIKGTRSQRVYFGASFRF
jgi:hypothetical protein